MRILCIDIWFPVNATTYILHTDFFFIYEINITQDNNYNILSHFYVNKINVYHNVIVNFILILYPWRFSGIVTNCVPIEQHIPNEDKMKWLETDIAIIGLRLRWFLDCYYLNFDNRDQILDQINLTKVCY